MTKPHRPEAADSREPDAHGQAALLLVESLIHGLAERKVITVSEALDIMECALEAQQAIDEDGAGASRKQAAVLLASLVASLEIDVAV